MIKKLCWFNQRWNVYFTSTVGWDAWTEGEVKTLKNEGGEYRLSAFTADDLTIYTFGWMANDPQQRPGHGGEWSSNAQNINKVFGTNLTEIGMDQIACSIDVDVLKEQLGDQYKIVETTYGMDILSVDDSEGKQHEWRVI